jgi:general secretion pathway protein G
MVVVAILATLAAIAVPGYVSFVDKARLVRAIHDIQQIDRALRLYYDDYMQFPPTLAAVNYGDLLDPWGNPYQYLNIATTKGKGALRKDYSLVPINTDFDLYSMGKDGKSQPPLTAKASHDDVIRAHDGGYIGLASRY